MDDIENTEKKIFAVLGGCLLTLDSFGRKPDDLPAIVGMWLESIPPDFHAHIPAAIKQHLRQSRTFPTPKEIIEILNPQPELDGFYYQELIRRRRNREEKYGDKEYIAAYEERAWQRMRAKPDPDITRAIDNGPPANALAHQRKNGFAGDEIN